GEVHHTAAPLWLRDEQFPVRRHAPHDVLGQLRAVYPDDRPPAIGYLRERAHVPLDVVLRGAGTQRLVVDAERVHPDLGRVPPVADLPGAAAAPADPRA